MIIFGIDPGTATTGYGIIKILEKDSKKLIELIDYDCIVTSKDMDMPMRLNSIQKDIERLLGYYKPDCVSIEQLFFGINSRTAMTVGQARGVVLSAAAGYRIPIFEYQGLHVKATITGSGKADKKEIQKHVMRYLGKRKLKKPKSGYIDDAADALAVAICHYLKITNMERMTPSVMKERAKKLGVSKKSKVVKVSQPKADRPMDERISKASATQADKRKPLLKK